ncbi:hypothetical protein JOD97_005894 [Duganella sp. 1411]|uniref:hypothetical protein n=1 Tax=Duganella sp. 1411 TaxID=2806572 RepID=UPI001AE2171E|nr:hypothetical protein [Duganella sp. 1411]MBP1207808.1 hypothetical protein [Duganella sp. 1411]
MNLALKYQRTPLLRRTRKSLGTAIERSMANVVEDVLNKSIRAQVVKLRETAAVAQQEEYQRKLDALVKLMISSESISSPHFYQPLNKVMLHHGKMAPPPVAQVTHFGEEGLAVINESTERVAEAQLRADRLAKHRKAVSLIAGLWKDHEGGPVDGVEYENEARQAW